MSSILDVINVPLDVGCQVGLNLSLKNGEGSVIKTPPNARSQLLASEFLGLTSPTFGEIRFCEKLWDSMSAWEACRARGGIRRVFFKEGWVSNLSIMENIVLSEQHHTRRIDAELYAEANSYAIALGMPSVPSVRPSSVSESILQRCSWVRSLMGDPALIIMEWPTRHAEKTFWPALLDRLLVRMDSGTTVLILSDDKPFIDACEAHGIGCHALGHQT